MNLCQESRSETINYRIHYKGLNDLATKVKYYSIIQLRGETMLVEINF